MYVTSALCYFIQYSCDKVKISRWSKDLCFLAILLTLLAKPHLDNGYQRCAEVYKI